MRRALKATISNIHGSYGSEQWPPDVINSILRSLTRVHVKVKNDERTEPMMSGLFAERVCENTDPAPSTSVGSPAWGKSDSDSARHTPQSSSEIVQTYLRSSAVALKV
jgi:hypothetical protein